MERRNKRQKKKQSVMFTEEITIKESVIIAEMAVVVLLIEAELLLVEEMAVNQGNIGSCQGIRNWPWLKRWSL